MEIHLPRGLPARQAQFLCLLAARPSLTRADYQRLLRVSHNTASRDLAELVAARLILALGRSSSRRYTLGPFALIEQGSQNGTHLARGAGQPPATVPITIDPIFTSSSDA